MVLAQHDVANLPIEKRHRPSYTEFAHDFLNANKPVIISGALDQWKAMQWTPEYFKKNFADLQLGIDGKEYRMADFIDLVLNSNENKPAPYLRNALIDRVIPALLPDIQPMPEYFSPNWLVGPLSQLLRSRLHGGSSELYIGGRGGKFPFLHYDTWHTHAFISQIYGTKEFTAYAPDQAPYLYLKPGRKNQSLVDIENPDYEKFPLFAKAIPMRFRLEPGEIIFIPAGWWHTAKMLSPSISVSVNRANASNWSELTKDMCSGAPLPMKPVAAVYLTGMRVFRTIYGS
ncbi:MAG TPA: cupin-like domain-containing protein [Terriglobales bacterium]|nr:cupin-like domain-containing protein [Terriglobales bacterium]